jgi:hypothetical protein
MTDCEGNEGVTHPTEARAGKEHVADEIKANVVTSISPVVIMTDPPACRLRREPAAVRPAAPVGGSIQRSSAKPSKNKAPISEAVEDMSHEFE